MVSKYANNRTEAERKAFWYNSDGLRRCSGCKSFLSVDNFHNDKSGIDGKGYACKSCVKSYQKKHYSDKERYALKKERDTDNYYKRNYGLTRADKLALIEEQNGCAICGVYHERMHVDHDHTTGKVRGVLCTNCNRGIGHLQENVLILTNAIKYLNKHNGSSVSVKEGRSR